MTEQNIAAEKAAIKDKINELIADLTALYNGINLEERASYIQLRGVQTSAQEITSRIARLQDTLRTAPEVMVLPNLVNQTPSEDFTTCFVHICAPLKNQSSCNELAQEVQEALGADYAVSVRRGRNFDAWTEGECGSAPFTTAHLELVQQMTTDYEKAESR